MIAAVAVTCAVRPMHAQDQVMVFQHGILSDENTWASIATQLGIGYHIEGHRFTTGSTNPYETQAGVLFNFMAGMPDTTIVVGHSNGGIVAREMSRNRHLKGIVTVATPHLGAGIMRSVNNGDLSWYVGFLSGTTSAPILQYSQYYDDSNAWTAAYYAFLSWDVIGQAFGLFAANWAAQNQALIAEMIPGSAYNQSLNGATNVGHEAAVVPNRVGIVSQIGFEGLMFRAFLTQGSTNYAEDVRYTFESAALGAYFYYADYDDYYDPYVYEKQYWAGLWYNAAVVLDNLDGDWCHLIGGSANWGGYPYCEASDAIVPISSQVYPNFTNRIDFGGASHGEETSSDATFQVLRSVFESAPFSITVRHIPDTLMPYMTGSVDVSTAPGCSIMYTARMPDGSEAYVQQWDSDGNLQPWGGGSALVSWSVVSGGHYVSGLIDFNGEQLWIGVDGIQAGPTGMDCHNY